MSDLTPDHEVPDTNVPGDEMLAEAGSATRKVDEAAEKIQRELAIVQPVELQTDTVALYMMDDERPIILKDKKEILLGRYSEEDADTLFDLMPYKGDLLGVSRRHAIIRSSTKHYSIEDLGSTNGTWLNENKIAPFVPYDLQNGDYIRLGQLSIRIYFNAERSTEEIVYLKDSSGMVQVTPQYMSTEVVPFLTALVEIQKVADELLNRKNNAITIHSIIVNPQGIIKVKLDGGGHAIDFTRTKVTDWRGKYRTGETSTASASGDDEAQASNLQVDSSAFRRKLTFDFLVQFPNKLSEVGEAQRSAYIERLMPHFKTLTSGALEITTTHPGNGS